MLHGLHREMSIVIQEIATPSLEHSPGCYRTKIGENSIEGEIHLFNMCFDYEQASAYRKSQGAYLRSNQWYDLEAEVWIVI